MKKFIIVVLLTLGFLTLTTKPADAFEAHTISVTARIQLSDVLLNEVYANTNAGEDEWVELYNRSGDTVDISGWTIQDPVDQPSHKIIVPAGTSLPPGGKFRGYFTTNVLNNGGDTVYLFDADGRLRDKFVYTETVKGKSWRRNPDGSSNWVDPKPSSPAELSPPPQPEPKPDPEPEPSTEPASESAPEPESGPKLEPQTESESEPEPTPQPEPQMESLPEASESAKIVEPAPPEATASAKPNEEELADET